MLRTVGPQGSLFELLLPPGMRVLSGELADVDALLDDERFFGPFRAFFDSTEGRPSIPIDTYLRLMRGVRISPWRGRGTSSPEPVQGQQAVDHVRLDQGRVPDVGHGVAPPTWWRFAENRLTRVTSSTA